MANRAKPQWSVTGLVEAPVEKVWQAVLEANHLTDIVRNARQTPIITEDEHAGRTEIDPQKHTVLRQGHWWYRGIHSVEAHPRGSLIRYDVWNIAPGVGWWAAQMVQGPQHAREMQGIMRESLQMIGKRLGCRAELMK
jgi:hypothetical protein